MLHLENLTTENTLKRSKESYWLQINIESCNGLVIPGAKRLHNPLLIQIDDAIQHH